MPYLNHAFSSHFERMTGKMTGKIPGLRHVDDWKISGIFPVVSELYYTKNPQVPITIVMDCISIIASV